MDRWLNQCENCQDADEDCDICVAEREAAEIESERRAELRNEEILVHGAWRWEPEYDRYGREY